MAKMEAIMLGIALLGTLAVPIGMITTGALYMNPGDCPLTMAPEYLIGAGGASLTFAIMRFLAIFCLGTVNNVAGVVLFIGCAHMMEVIVTIAHVVYGTYAIMAKTGDWTNADPTSGNYCHEAPFLFAFVMIILYYIFVIGPTLAYILKRCCGTSAAEREEEERQRMESAKRKEGRLLGNLILLHHLQQAAEARRAMNPPNVVTITPLRPAPPPPQPQLIVHRQVRVITPVHPGL